MMMASEWARADECLVGNSSRMPGHARTLIDDATDEWRQICDRVVGYATHITSFSRVQSIVILPPLRIAWASERCSYAHDAMLINRVNTLKATWCCARGDVTAMSMPVSVRRGQRDRIPTYNITRTARRIRRMRSAVCVLQTRAMVCIL